MRRRGFTLVEISVVIGLLLLLSALLFPAFNSAKRRSHQAACLSNLRQLGMSVMLYTQDNDSLFPLGGDPTDINTNSWNSAFKGEFVKAAKDLRPLPIVMQPYVKDSQLWHCPSDDGFDRADIAGSPRLNARPTSFDAFGTSYYYRTELALRRKIDLMSYEAKPPHIEHGPAEINMLFDGYGTWHSYGGSSPKRYNVLMADGHAVNITSVDFNKSWSLILQLPKAN